MNVASNAAKISKCVRCGGQRVDRRTCGRSSLELTGPTMLVRPSFEDDPNPWPTLRRLLSSSPRQPFHDVASEMANHGRSSHRLQQSPAPGSTPSVISSLRPRELQILRLISHQLSNAEIAAALFNSPNTPKTHTRGLYKKLGVTNVLAGYS